MEKFYYGETMICINPVGPLKKDYLYTCGGYNENSGEVYIKEFPGLFGHPYRSANDSRFVPVKESKFRAVTFEKICEEVELICSN